MLRVTVEIVPFGSEKDKRTIGTIEISNVAGDNMKGDYKVDFVSDEFLMQHRICGFKRSKGAWSLVAVALKGLGYK